MSSADKRARSLAMDWSGAGGRGAGPTGPEIERFFIALTGLATFCATVDGLEIIARSGPLGIELIAELQNLQPTMRRAAQDMNRLNARLLARAAGEARDAEPAQSAEAAIGSIIARLSRIGGVVHRMCQAAKARAAEIDAVLLPLVEN